MITRSALVAVARRWVGTPYHHQARLRGIGVDCAGLIAAVGHDAGVLPDLDREAWKPIARYGRQPNPKHMAAVLRRFLFQIDESPLIGDVAWIEWREGLPMHLAILADLDGRPMIIHALGEAGEVVEHDFSSEWQDRVVGWWRYPGLI